MSRSKSRSSIDICADCGSSDPSWASINRGILLCIQCCSVHRSMGRHISHVKSLRQGIWPPSLLTMVNTLTAQNVNSIWEHSLLDPAAPKHLRRKPQPKDSLHPTKAEFIQAKHRRLAYVFRPRRDDVPCSAAELSRQLHSSVRSANLDISLRFLVQGADPNYFSQEKGTSCLHVACRAGHSSQAELLVAWGADPNTRDASGINPSQAARQGGHFELAERMVELVYEVTDRLAYYLCNKKPDHAAGQHYINLDKTDSNEMTDIAKAARGKLQLLPNHLFEELVMDIYDEVDRRECEAVWNTSAVGLERFGVAFLPVNPALSAPRNQGRQKLARLSPAEMGSLLRDVLMDATRRQHIATLNPHTNMSALDNNNIRKANKLKQFSHLSDDEPLYDSVASDDDYAALTPMVQNNHKELNINNSPKSGEIVSKAYEASIPIEQSFNPVQKAQFVNHNETIHENISDVQNTKEMEQLQDQLNSKDNLISELKSELQQWQKTVENLKNENVILRNILDKNRVTAGHSPPTRDVSVLLNTPHNFKTVIENNSTKESDDHEPQIFDGRILGRTNQRPISMYETREGPKLNWQITKHQLTTVGGLDRGLAQSLGNTNLVPEENLASSMPLAEDVHNYAEGVTKGIRELWAAMQDTTTFGHTFILKADKIKQTVHQLLNIFPEKCEDENICSVLSQLSTSCEGLSRACSLWGNSGETSEGDTMLRIPSAAYELAKATKLLVTNFPLDQNNIS